MRTLKWALLVTCGGVLSQLAGCADTLLYYVLDVVATQIVTAALTAAAGSAAA